MTQGGPQRHYRAPCPGCGAPVEFQSAQASFAVCSYCHSTVVRSGEVLRRIGVMAEEFTDFSPLQRMASGRVDGQAFTLIGRLQYQGEAGKWTEWVALLPDGSTGTLSEDNGRYVFTRPWVPAQAPPGADACQLGQTVVVGGESWTVSARMPVRLLAAEGELPKLPPPGQAFDVAELRSADGQVLSIDYGSQPPRLERGRSVELPDLQLTGLKDESTRQERARQFACPHCGAQVQVRLDTSRGVTCGNCRSLIDISAGIAGELQAVQQGKPDAQPLIELGASGLLRGTEWQVVGFQRRRGTEPGDDESFDWSEYLLYNRERGFAFLVDASDGWSLVQTATGAPRHQAGGKRVSYLGTTYELQSTYRAVTTYVLGEFYWPVRRGEKTSNRDYAHGIDLLSIERSEGEDTVSVGSRIAGDMVAEAFRMADRKALFQRDEVGPFVAAKGVGCGTLVLAIIGMIIISALLDRCDGGSNYSRSSSGSFGGYSSGGSHK